MNNNKNQKQEPYIVYFGIYKWNTEIPIRIAEIFNEPKYSMFTKSTVLDVCSSITRLVVKKSAPNTLKSIPCTSELTNNYFINDHKIFVSIGADEIAYIFIALNDFSNRLLLEYINMVKIRTVENMGIIESINANTNKNNINAGLDDVKKDIVGNLLYKKDAILKINNDLDQVQNIMVENISNMIDRGEKIDDLVLKAIELEKSTEDWDRKTKDLNSCCVIL